MIEKTSYNDSGEVLSKNNFKSVEDSDKVFTKVEIEPSFPGGASEWTRYFTRQIEKKQNQLSERDFGTCLVRFIVGLDGKVTDVIATTMQGSKLAEIAVQAVLNGPKWIPAMQNGRPVRSYRIQPVSLTNLNSR